MSLVRMQSVEALGPREICKHACLGCPAVARGVLRPLVAPRGPAACAFETYSIEAGERVPAAWLASHDFAIVRRGYLIRERVDSFGSSTAIDVVGPGCCFPIHRERSEAEPPRFTAYAVTHALVCACDEPAVAAALDHGGSAAKDLYALERETVARMERLADARARGGSTEKIAALLCAMSDTLKPGHDDPRIPPEFLQRDLARLLSIRHESVCRALRDFARRGLIVRDADGIAITDRAALERVRAVRKRSARSST